VFFGVVFTATDAADDGVLGTSTALGGVAEGPTPSALLDEWERLEALGTNCASEHEKAGLEQARGGLAILIKEGKRDRAVSGVGRYVSL
jgi:hypothetical protein